MTASADTAQAAALGELLAARVAAGERFAGMFAAAPPGEPPAAKPAGGLLISAHLAVQGGVDTVDAVLPPGAASYPAVTRHIGAAFWYEREMRDMFGVTPEGHPRPERLILPPGDEHTLARHVTGQGMFTIPHGPVRSGVFESIEYLVETPGEDIPHLNMRVFYKHRGIGKRFEGLTAADGVVLAERVEGISSVAHALAYCNAIERIAGCAPPRPAQLVRVLHAELERIANHLDVAGRLADAAGLAVATARFGLHKERVLRLVSRLSGSRYGRGVVVPGGVGALPQAGPSDVFAEVGRLEPAISSDAAALMGTASFLDRLRRTGPLLPDRAREHGALGPIGRASGFADDARLVRPYDAYSWLNLPSGEPHAPGGPHTQGDALARLRVRFQEISQSFHLIRQAVGELSEAAPGSGEAVGSLAAACEPVDGRAVGWAEAPQGEVLYDVRMAGGRIAGCRPRSASFHNLVLMHEVFAGDILTDFPFIEASFGLSVAGVAL
ncbi:MAG: NADH-quinone oxidoreductase subunit C [Micromonosporaceae bacterium]